MTTYNAIVACGIWARKAGAHRTENPFIVATSYAKAWYQGWDEQDKRDTQKKVATLQPDEKFVTKCRQDFIELKEETT